MKVFIGPYKSWIGPYQIAEALCFWARPHKDEHGFESKPEWVHDFGTWLSGGTAKDSILLKVCQWIESKRKRSTYIKIDKYDTWSMDSTLAFIILPMLKQLKATKHGGPFVDDADVPLPIRSTAPGARDRCENDWDTDEHHFTRWDYVLDEMIFAFNSKNDDSWQDKYHTGDHDIKFVPSAWDETGKPTMHEMIRGPRDTHQWDYEGMKKEQARITNGFRLFGKYYENLWD